MNGARYGDGSAGDVDYGRHGGSYSTYRRPDPRIEAAVRARLGDARTVVNVGAGAGSYEPLDLVVTAVEPSASMRAQRPAHLAAAIDATAEDLPFGDGEFDAAMATFTVHQWPDLARGLRELRRVARGPVVILTGDPALLARFWLAEYAPAVIDTEVRRHPPISTLAEHLGRTCTVTTVPIPFDCTDGFNEAYYGRPEALLDPGARQACSGWSFVPPDVARDSVHRLRAALADGTWDREHGALRTQPTFLGSLVIVAAE